MTLKEAIESGKPFRRRRMGSFWVIVGDDNISFVEYPSKRPIAPITVRDILADDWEIKQEMEKICKNCKYYTPPEGFGRAYNYGTCNSSKFIYSGINNSTLNDELAYYDYEGYDADFYVGENFGCIHFEPKEDKQK